MAQRNSGQTRTAFSSNDDANIRRGDRFRDQCQWGQAVFCYRAALAVDGENFAATFGLGAALFELGKADEALALLWRAVELDGGSAEAHAALGRVLDRLLEWEDAVAAFERSLTLRPADQQTLLALGGALSRLDRRGELQDWLKKAIAAEPDTAMLHGMLAGQLLAFGHLDAAVAAMDRMIALDPNNGLAHAFLSDMKTYTPDDPHFAALEAAANRNAPAEEHCVLRYALARAYADVGRHAESFDLYLEANRLRRRMLDYDVAHTLSEFRRLETVFTPELMRTRRGSGDPSDRTVFIVGVMRSGTTLVEQILAAHPRVHGLGERPDFRAAASRPMQVFPEQVPTLGAADLRRIGEDYMRLAGAGARDAVRITDKTLNNDVFVGLIHLALPHARIVHVVRDAVDTCLSAFATNFGAAYPYTTDLSDLGRIYRAQRRMMAYWRRLLPRNAFFEIRYEDVVADIEGQARRLLDFCGLEWDPVVLAFDKSPRAVWTASAAQVRRPLYSSSVGRWRPSAEILRPLLDGLDEYAAPTHA